MGTARRRYRVLGFLALLLTTITGALVYAGLHDEDFAGTVLSVVGPAEISVVNVGTSQARKVHVQESIFVGDKIITSAEQTVTLQLAERSEIIIAPQSSFQIEKFHRTEGKQETILHLFYGVVRSLVRKAYSSDETYAIKTPSSVMGVRGTEFVVSVNASSRSTEVHTLHGQVAVASGTSLASLRDPTQIVMVAAGSMTRALAGANIPTSPAPFQAAQFRQQIREMAPSMEQKIQWQPAPTSPTSPSSPTSPTSPSTSTSPSSTAPTPSTPQTTSVRSNGESPPPQQAGARRFDRGADSSPSARMQPGGGVGDSMASGQMSPDQLQNAKGSGGAGTPGQTPSRAASPREMARQGMMPGGPGGRPGGPPGGDRHGSGPAPGGGGTTAGGTPTVSPSGPRTPEGRR